PPSAGASQRWGGAARGGRTIPVLEQRPPGQVTDGRLLGGEQPRQGGGGRSITRAVHGGVIAEPDADGAATSRNRPTSENTPFSAVRIDAVRLVEGRENSGPGRCSDSPLGL